MPNWASFDDKEFRKIWLIVLCSSWFFSQYSLEIEPINILLVCTEIIFIFIYSKIQLFLLWLLEIICVDNDHLCLYPQIVRLGYADFPILWSGHFSNRPLVVLKWTCLLERWCCVRADQLAIAKDSPSLWLSLANLHREIHFQSDILIQCNSVLTWHFQYWKVTSKCENGRNYWIWKNAVFVRNKCSAKKKQSNYSGSTISISNANTNPCIL